MTSSAAIHFAHSIDKGAANAAAACLGSGSVSPKSYRTVLVESWRGVTVILQKWLHRCKQNLHNYFI
jgi:hypothetical protein